MNLDIIQQVRDHNPLIHNLTNDVVTNFTANGLLAFGASPIMSKSIDEVADIVKRCDGLLINTGTLTASDGEAMTIAGQAANKKKIPVVLDPVGVGATPFRSTIVQHLIKNVKFTAIKGNAGEMAHLVNIPWKTKGVDSIDDDNIENIKKIAYKVAKTYETIAVVTGKIDVICVNGNIRTNKTGHIYLTKVTGTGCLLGSILAACLTTRGKKIEQAYSALYYYGLAAEYAASKPEVEGPGTFSSRFIDALSLRLKEE